MTNDIVERLREKQADMDDAIARLDSGEMDNGIMRVIRLESRDLYKSAADEIERLRAENERLREENAQWMRYKESEAKRDAAHTKLFQRMADEIERLRALLASERQDAARYRWLADRMSHVSHPNGAGWTMDEVLISYDRDLQDVIDAAMSE